MKYIIILLIAIHIPVYAQKNERRPSWSDDIPKKQDAPNFKIDVEFDNDSDFVIDRDSLFGSEIENNESETENNNKIQEEKPAVESKAAAELAEKNRVVEAERLAEEKRAVERKATAELAEKNRVIEAERLAEEKRAVERKAAAELAEKNREIEAERLAEEKRAVERKVAAELAEKNRLAEEKRKSDLKAAEELEQQNRLIDAKDLAAKIRAEESLRASEKLQKEKLALESANELVPKNNIEQDVISVDEYVWKKIKHVDPIYPKRAVRQGQEGWVNVELVIANNGRVIDAIIKETDKNYKGFNNAVIEAVSQWEFDPPINHGIQGNQSTTVRLVFQL